MTDIKLPEPLKVKPSIAKYLDDLEEEGKTIFSFESAAFIESLAYLFLLNKYKSKCIALTRPDKNILQVRSIGLTINLKLKYSKEEEENFKTNFTALSEIIVNCIKRGENTIIIPLAYQIRKSGHANMLILRMNHRELEHFEPHGGEFSGNERMQLSSKKVLTFFVNILNKNLKKDNLPVVKYVEASDVCPYISGLQDIEGKSKLKKGKLEPAGYCSAWSIFFAELCLKNPELPSVELLNNIYNYLTTKESGPDYLKSVIRGYAGYIMQKIDIYLSIFFKPDVTAKELIDNPYSIQHSTVHEAIEVLVNLETYLTMNPDIDIKKELKQAMKEYRNLTKGKSKEEQVEMRRGFRSLKNVRDAYYKKRILQNFEEYKRVGRVTSDPIFDSPEEIDRAKIKNLTILEKGLLHEKINEEKMKRQEELMKQDLYGETSKQKTKTIKKLKRINKTKKNKLPDVLKEKIDDKEKLKLVEIIIKKNNINMSTKEGRQKLLEILIRMGSR